MPESAIRVLLVEDSPSDALLIREGLIGDRLAHFEVTVIERLAEGLAFLATDPCHVVLLDLGLPDSQGFSTFQAMHVGFPDLPIVVLSGLADEELAIRSVQWGAQDYIVKGGAEMTVLGHALRYAVERQEVRRRQRANERRWRTLIEQSADAIALIDVDDVILYQSPAATRILGYPVAELVGRHNIELVFPEDRECAIADFARALANPRKPIVSLHRVVHRDGATHWIEGIVTNWLDDPELRAFVFNYRDVTERMLAQQGLEELNRTLEARVTERTAEVIDLYENAPCGYHSLDADGRFIHINQTELNWLGYTREELIGQPISFLLTPASLKLFREHFLHFKVAGELTDLELDLVRKDGTLLTINVNANAVYAPDGQYLTSRSTVVDFTERKRVESELARAIRVKDEFLANMSHELRTPLNGILAFAESLQDQVYGPLNERQLRSLRNIETSGRHLLALINDLLDLSKIEAGQLELHRETVIVNEVCQASLMFVKDMASKKQIQLDFESSSPRAIIFADARRLKQMLVNLLSNAVKFTPEYGKVQLTVTVDPTNTTIVFAVQDTGPGINAEDQERLFQPFTQLDTAMTRTAEGTGLGLALVKRLAMQHGGTVRVDSAGIPGQGSCFTVTLPVIDVAASATTLSQSNVTMGVDIQLLAAPAPGLEVLLVEDNEVTISVNQEFLEWLGYRLTIARTGSEGLELARTKPPDLILMDIQLPDMDGLAVMTRLRADARFATTPIIATTAYAMAGDRERCLQAGASHYMSKPLSLHELAALMKTLILRRTGTS